MQETWVQSLGWEDLNPEWKVYPLHYSGLENSTDCIVHGVAKCQTGLSDFHFHTFTFRTNHHQKLPFKSPTDKYNGNKPKAPNKQTNQKSKKQKTLEFPFGY